MNNDEILQVAHPTSGRMFGVRHLQIFLLSSCLAVALTMRVNMSVSIVPMTNSSRGNPDFPDYGWSSSTQSIILSSFSWGYVVTMIPAGQLGQMYGPKMFLLGAIAINSVFCLLTPLAARIGDWQLVCLCRVLQGLCQGFCFPCCHILLSKWSTSEERGTFTSYVYSAAQAGTFIAHLICGALIKSSAGWPTVFYLFGSLGIIWSIAWFYLGANDPESHKYISKEEKMYLESCLSQDVKKGQQKRSTPWYEIFTSGPVWAVIISQCGANWGFWTLLTEIPSYLSYIYNVDLAENGLLSALPYFTHWIASFLFSGISRFMLSRKIVSLEISRKIFNTIGLGVAAIPLAGLTLVPPDNTVLAVALLTICVGTTSAYYVGHHVNHIDLAPNYAGTMMGIGHCAGNILAIMAPLLVGVTVEDQNDPSEWYYVFYVAAGFYIFSTITFIFMGKATIQPWNNPEFKSNRRKCF